MPKKLPVVLFAWRRPSLTKKVLQAIRAYKPDVFYVFVDGPRLEHPSDALEVEEVLELLGDIDWECSLKVTTRPHNIGLRQNVITGISKALGEHQLILVFEDDCLPNEDFFLFADSASEFVLQSNSLGMLGGRYSGSKLASANSYISTHYKIWGWGVCREAWEIFLRDQELSLRLAEAQRIVANSPIGPFQRKFLKTQLNRRARKDTWALDFYLSQLKAGLWAIYPTRNLVKNIGFGQESTHTLLEAWWEEPPYGSLGSGIAKKGLNLAKHGILVTKLEFFCKAIRFWVWPVLHPLAFIARIKRYLVTRNVGRAGN